MPGRLKGSGYKKKAVLGVRVSFPLSTLRSLCRTTTATRAANAYMMLNTHTWGSPVHVSCFRVAKCKFAALPLLHVFSAYWKLVVWRRPHTPHLHCGNVATLNLLLRCNMQGSGRKESERERWWWLAIKRREEIRRVSSRVKKGTKIMAVTKRGKENRWHVEKKSRGGEKLQLHTRLNCR